MSSAKNLASWSTPAMLGSPITPTTDLIVKSITVSEDIEITDNTKGVIFTDSASVRWRVTMETDGSLKRTQLP